MIAEYCGEAESPLAQAATSVCAALAQISSRWTAQGGQSPAWTLASQVTLAAHSALLPQSTSQRSAATHVMDVLSQAPVPEQSVVQELPALQSTWSRHEPAPLHSI